MKIKVFRSLWGCEGIDFEYLVPKLKKEGYDGIEGSLSDIGKDPQHFLNLLKENNMDYICGLYTKWDDYENYNEKDLDEQIEQYKVQISRARALSPLRVNVHSGNDYWSFEEMSEFFSQALKIEKDSGLTVSHETHRGRALFNPWTTLRLLHKFDDLKITADLSHWVVISERMFQTPREMELLKFCSTRANHIHARVGYPEGPQVSDPSAPENSEYVSAFYSWWKLIWESQKERKFDETTMCVEYGPVPYLQSLPYTKAPVANLDTICSVQEKSLRRAFHEWNKI